MWFITIVISIMVLVMFVALRFVFISPLFNYNDFCRWEYGGNWTSEYHNTFGRTCVELDYITLKGINRKDILLSIKEITNKYCEKVSFWDFTRWDSKCGNKQ